MKGHRFNCLAGPTSFGFTALTDHVAIWTMMKDCELTNKYCPNYRESSPSGVLLDRVISRIPNSHVDLGNVKEFFAIDILTTIRGF